MCVVETKDAEQAIEMKKVLEAKYDHLTMMATGLAHGIGEFGDGDDGDDDDESEDPDLECEMGDTLSQMSSLRPQRKTIRSFSNKVCGGSKIPVMSLRRGSMAVQTITKTPECFVSFETASTLIS